MPGREAPFRAHLPKQIADARVPRAPQAPIQVGRCLGAAAQLAAVHKMLRGGPLAQLQAADSGPVRSAKAAGRPGITERELHDSWPGPLGRAASRNTTGRLLTRTHLRSGVIQRMVPLGLNKGTKVYIIRSTSREFHNERATIQGLGANENEYVVKIDVRGDVVAARADQLRLEGSRDLLEPPQFDFAVIQDRSIEDIRKMVKDLVKSETDSEGEIVFGGSFAAFLHAMKSRTAARTPRDVDVISYDPELVRDKPKTTKMLFCGIPLELHPPKGFTTPGPEEKASGIMSAGALLAAHMLKLRDVNFNFEGQGTHKDKAIPKTAKPPRAAIKGDKDSITAEELFQRMRGYNDTFMKMADGDPDYMSDSSKAVWMKTISDIETLARIGDVRAPVIK